MLDENNIVVPEIAIRGNVLNFVKSTSNLDIVFNYRLMWFYHINIDVGRVDCMLWNLRALVHSTLFGIRMQLYKTYSIPVLLYGSMLAGILCPLGLRLKL